MRGHLTGLAVMTIAAPVLACHAGAEETGSGARDRALGEEAEGPEPSEATRELLRDFPGYYVLTEGRDSEGALASLYLGEGEMREGGVQTGESRRRDADCETYDCDFVVSDTYRALPPELSVNEAYLLIDAERQAPQAFYAVEHVEFDGAGRVASLHLRHAPEGETLGDRFVLERWDDAPDLRPDIRIDSLDELPGSYTREGSDAQTGEILDVQFGPDVAGDGGELAGSFVREIEQSCTGEDCNVESGERYMASPEGLGVGIARITFETETGGEDHYIIDEVVRDAEGTIVRLAVRDWQEHEMGRPFALARRGYGN